MSEVTKPDWPQTPDGTIDWETVFEDPETGIIPAISLADNKLILHKVTVEVIKQLFTRKNDESQVEKFTRELVLILGETEGLEDLPKMKGSIVDLLRRIKAGRIEKAAAYVAEQKQEAAEDAKNKRRLLGGRKKKRRVGERSESWLHTIIALSMAGLFFVVLLVVAYVLLFGTRDDYLTGAITAKIEQMTGQVPAEEMDEALETPPEPEAELEVSAMPLFQMSETGYPLDKMNRDMASELGLNVLAMSPIIWAGRVEGGYEGSTILLPILIIRDEETSSIICKYEANLIDAINLALDRSLTRGEFMGPDLLRRAGTEAVAKINERLGKSWVTDLYLLHKFESNLLNAAKHCTLISNY